MHKRCGLQRYEWTTSWPPTSQVQAAQHRIKAALAKGSVTLRDADGGEHVMRDATFQVVVGAETLDLRRDRAATAVPAPPCGAQGGRR